MHVLINAIHTTSGGGVVYLNGILPHLLVEEGLKVSLFIQEQMEGTVRIPEGVTLYTVPKMSFLKSHIYEQFKLPFLARKLKADVMFCNANYVPFLAKNPIVTIHNDPRVWRYTKTLGEKLYWWVLIVATRFSIVRCKRVISVSNHIIPLYAGGIWKWLAKKITVASPAVEIHEEISLKSRNTNLLLAVGDIYIQKNYGILIEAIALLKKREPDVKLKIVGRPIDHEEYERLLDLVKLLDLEHIVEFTGHVPHKEVLTQLKQAGIFVSTSLVEAFNIPVVEALACSTPTILADTSYAEEVAGRGALFVSLDKGGDVPAALAIAIYGLLNNPKLAQVLSKKGYAHVKQYNWYTTSQNIIKAIKETLPKQGF